MLHIAWIQDLRHSYGLDIRMIFRILLGQDHIILFPKILSKHFIVNLLSIDQIGDLIGVAANLGLLVAMEVRVLTKVREVLS